MSVPVWAGGVVTTLWLAYLSFVARRWWPLAWLCTIFMGAGAGLVLAAVNARFAGLWWTFWMGYTLALPIIRFIVRRRDDRDEAHRRYLERQYNNILNNQRVDLPAPRIPRGW